MNEKLVEGAEKSTVCLHRGNPVQVWKYTIFAGGTQYGLTLKDLCQYDVVIPLTEVTERSRQLLTNRVELKYYPLKDFGGVSDDWKEFVQGVIRDLEKGKRVFVFCIGSHGRTGTLLASLVALLEPGCEDPIAAVRERHCSRAVETKKQAMAVFALKGMPLPAKYNTLL